MTVNSHLSTLAGYPVRAFDASAGLPADASGVAWRLSTEEYDEPLAPLVEAFLAQDALSTVQAIVIGAWGEAFDAEFDGVDALLAAKDRLPALRGLFVGDMTYEECEISWIQQGSINRFLTAFPALEVFGVRGGTGLEMVATTHTALQELIVETGGLPSEVLQAIGASTFPVLHTLTVWLGSENYGAPSDTDCLKGIYAGAGLPAVRTLGLMNSELTDAIAAEVADAPILQHVETLDLSMGTIGDEGAAALAKAGLACVKRLVLDHHYMSDEAITALRAAHPGIAISAEGREDDSDYGRYVAVSE